jgi:KUP system potassium uptake protein
MTNASRTDEIEEKVMYSIPKRPKRAIYIGLYVNILTEP